MFTRFPARLFFVTSKSVNNPVVAVRMLPAALPEEEVAAWFKNLLLVIGLRMDLTFSMSPRTPQRAATSLVLKYRWVCLKLAFKIQ